MSTYDIQTTPRRSAVVRLLESAALPSSDLTDEQMQDFFFSGPADEPIGVVGLEFHGPDALLRSLVVATDYRSHGLGATLVQHAETRARERHSESIFVLTTTAAGFFTRRGYVSAARDSAPPAIARSREFASLCPVSSAFMVKHL